VDHKHDGVMIPCCADRLSWIPRRRCHWAVLLLTPGSIGAPGLSDVTHTKG
jgi:hypothetical protein